MFFLMGYEVSLLDHKLALLFRLFVQDFKKYSQNNSNVPPGTVVDTTITRRDQADFFLCSHAGESHSLTTFPLVSHAHLPLSHW